jgi:hypothetical protein
MSNKKTPLVLAGLAAFIAAGMRKQTSSTRPPELDLNNPVTPTPTRPIKDPVDWDQPKPDTNILSTLVTPTIEIKNAKLSQAIESPMTIPGITPVVQTAMTTQGIVVVVPPNGQAGWKPGADWPSYYVDGTPIVYDPAGVYGGFKWANGITGIQNPNHPIEIGIPDPNATRTPTYAPDYTPVRTDGQFWYSADGTIVTPDAPFRPIDPSMLPGATYRSPNADEINKGLGTNY